MALIPVEFKRLEYIYRKVNFCNLSKKISNPEVVTTFYILYKTHNVTLVNILCEREIDTYFNDKKFMMEITLRTGCVDL